MKNSHVRDFSMHDVGKIARFRRLLNPRTGRMYIVPIDHGAVLGPIEGIVDVKDTIDKVVRGGADSLLINRGIMRYCMVEHLGRVGVILRISSNNFLSPEFPFETVVASVEEALRLGADAVAFTVNVGEEGDVEGLRLFGAIADACAQYSMPLLGEFIPAGKKVDNPYAVRWVKIAARLGAELGADFIKTNYTGSVESFREVVKSCPVPIVIAGGPKTETLRDTLEMVKGAIEAGAIGVCIGRNTWQAKNPRAMARAISRIVHEEISVNEALKELEAN
jgi:fructose-bisphosphate aldolase/2-amino-3,7-dideoxy-D-threo-hept-6-ulosonate synthase